MRQYGNDRLADQLIREWDAAQKISDPTARQTALTAYENRLAEANRIIKQTTASGVSAETRQETAINTQVAKLLEGNRAYKNARRDSMDQKLTQKERDDAARLMQDIELRTRNTLSNAPRQLTPGDNLYQSRNVSGGPYSISGWNE